MTEASIERQGVRDCGYAISEYKYSAASLPIFNLNL